jgi:hypothetical protein
VHWPLGSNERPVKVHGFGHARASTCECLCVRSGLMAAHASLRASALLALTKLMAIDAAFCDANLRLLFTLLQNRCPVHPPNRSDVTAQALC